VFDVVHDETFTFPRGYRKKVGLLAAFQDTVGGRRIPAPTLHYTLPFMHCIYHHRCSQKEVEEEEEEEEEKEVVTVQAMEEGEDAADRIHKMTIIVMTARRRRMRRMR